MHALSTSRCLRRWGSGSPGRAARPRCGILPPARCSPRAQAQESSAEQQEVQLQVEVINSISKVSQQEWDEVATSGGETNPFLLWDFINALEASGSAVPSQGWGPQHLLVRDQQGVLQGACPLYLKGHSYGEYVFDQSWANYSHLLGHEYYPKLQSCVPFTPVTGPRLMARPGALQPAVGQALARGLLAVADALQVSSLHVTFNTESEWRALAPQGLLQRTGVQFHWDNNGYSSFEDFLSSLKQSKRKSIRQERRSVERQGLRASRLHGSEVGSAGWDAFYQFYLSTVDKRFGTAYLTRDFFHMLGESLGERVMLAAAHDEGGEMVAGALNLIGSHSVYGRNWGCLPGREYKHLHFELCYYQALEEAIERGLPRVEAGAQGEHKLQRGYLPSLTYSSHYIRDPQLRHAVGMFLDRERDDMDYTLQMLTLEGSPYKQEVTIDHLAKKLRQGQQGRGESEDSDD